MKSLRSIVTPNRKGSESAQMEDTKIQISPIEGLPTLEHDRKLKPLEIYLSGTWTHNWRSKLIPDEVFNPTPITRWSDIQYSSNGILDRFNAVGIKPFSKDFVSETEIDECPTDVMSGLEGCQLAFFYLNGNPDPITLSELGYAMSIAKKSRLKPVEGFDDKPATAFFDSPRICVYLDETAMKKCESSPYMAYLKEVYSLYNYPVPVEKALKLWIYKYNYDFLLHPESPIELAFWNEWLDVFWDDDDSATHLEPNYPVYNEVTGRNFYIDFAHPDTGVAVELDGMGHFGQSMKDGESKYLDEEKIQHHYYRHRLLQEDGWEIIRFTGREVKNNTRDNCEFVKRVINNRLRYPSNGNIDPLLSKSGKELKRMRVDAGLTQRDASNLTGIPRNSFSGFERGERYLPADKEALLRRKYLAIIQPKIERILDDTVPATYSDEDRLETEDQP